jgi:hypothetical protein
VTDTFKATKKSKKPSNNRKTDEAESGGDAEAHDEAEGQ